MKASFLARVSLIAALAAGIGSLAWDSPAAASPLPSASAAACGPVSGSASDQGSSSLLAPPAMNGGSSHTFQEGYNSACYGLTQDLGDVPNLNDVGVDFAASALWQVVLGIASVTISLLEWAFKLDLVSSLGSQIQAVVHGIGSVVIPLVASMVVLTGLWFVWQAMIRHKATTAWEGALWAFGAAAVLFAFLAQPTALVSGAEQSAASVGNAMMGSVADSGVVLGPSDHFGAAYGAKSGALSGSSNDVAIRQAANVFWVEYVYHPWLIAEFGSLGAGEKYGPQWLQSQAQGNGDVHYLDGSTGILGIGSHAGIVPSSDGATLSWVQGKEPDRLVVVALAVLGVVVVAALVIMLSLAVILAQLLLVTLLMLAPLFLVVGIYPGHGRRIALRWAELVLSSLLRRIAYSVALMVLLTITASLVEASGGNWFVAAVLPALVGVVMIHSRKTITGIVTGFVGLRGEDGGRRREAVATALGAATGYALMRRRRQGSGREGDDQDQDGPVDVGAGLRGQGGEGPSVPAPTLRHLRSVGGEAGQAAGEGTDGLSAATGVAGGPGGAESVAGAAGGEAGSATAAGGGLAGGARVGATALGVGAAVGVAAGVIGVKAAEKAVGHEALLGAARGESEWAGAGASETRQQSPLRAALVGAAAVTTANRLAGPPRGRRGTKATTVPHTGPAPSGAGSETPAESSSTPPSPPGPGAIGPAQSDPPALGPPPPPGAGGRPWPPPPPPRDPTGHRNARPLGAEEGGEEAGVNVRLEGGRLILRPPADPAQLKRVEQLRGARWDPDSRVWRVPMGSGPEVMDLATALNWRVADGALEAVAWHGQVSAASTEQGGAPQPRPGRSPRIAKPDRR